MYMTRSLNDLRIPVSLAMALLPTTVLFWCLWALTKVDVSPPSVPAFDIDWERKLVDTDLEIKPPKTLEIPPPPIRQALPQLPIPDSGGHEVPIDNFPRFKSERPDFGSNLPLGVNSEPIPQIRVNPVYPVRAVEQGLEGWVKVQFTITASGAIKDAKIIASSAAIFEDTAIKAITRWRYSPMVVDGVGMERVGVQTVLRFKLEN